MTFSVPLCQWQYDKGGARSCDKIVHTMIIENVDSKEQAVSLALKHSPITRVHVTHELVKECP